METKMTWGGLIETVEKCENFSECTEQTKTLFEKVHSLEDSKNIPELFHILKTFTETERNYLNSSLLDELHEISSTDTAKSPVLECCRKNKPLALNFLLKIDPNLRKKNAGFIEGCQYGHIEIVKILVKLVDFHDECSYSYLPLRVASLCGRVEVVEFLLDIYKNDDYISIALDYACQRGRKTLVKVLIEKYKGTNLNFDRALHFACEHGCKDTVELLLQNGANVQIDNRDYFCQEISALLQKYST